ncbi:nucleus export protein Brr6p [Monosporozyma servazzii]
MTSLIPPKRHQRYDIDGNPADSAGTIGSGKWYDPDPLNRYFKIIFNVVITSTLLFILYRFIHLIAIDVQWKLTELEMDDMKQLRQCQWKFEENKCYLSTNEIPPRLKQMCQEWSQCMDIHLKGNRHKSHSAKLWVKTLAEVVNTFVENITLRSLLFILVTVCSIVIVTNTIFGSYRVVYYNK